MINDAPKMNPEHASQHIEYELARFNVGNLSQDMMIIDRIQRVLDVMESKGVIRNGQFDLHDSEDGRKIFLCWEHPFEGRVMEAELSVAMLTFEMAKNMQAVYSMMVQ